MIVDTSALLAVLFLEPEAERFAEVRERSETLRISAASYLESSDLCRQQ